MKWQYIPNKQLLVFPSWYMLISNSVPNSGLVGYRSLLVGAIAIFGVLSGYLPGLSFSSPQALPQLLFTAPAQAQSVGDEELRTYVRAAFQIEMLRRQTYNNISSVNNGSVPEISCNNQAAINSLDGNVSGLVWDFCNQSADILRRYDMTTNRFNQISSSRLSDANLDGRIRRIAQELSPRRSR